MNLCNYNRVVINSSGGKDSQVSIWRIVTLAKRQGFPLGHITVSHQCLGDMEWAGTKELARKQAEFFGLEFVVTKYRNKAGEELSLLDYVRNRRRWPDNGNRYCTSDFKRGPGNRVLTMMKKRARADGVKTPRILQVFGFRAEESPARAKRAVLTLNPRASGKTADVYDYLPIHKYTEAMVWGVINTTGMPHHPAYDKGMPRLSCVFCIFAPRSALIIAGRECPKLLAEYVKVEAEIGHTFRHNFSIAEVQDAIVAGEDIDTAGLHGNWNM